MPSPICVAAALIRRGLHVLTLFLLLSDRTLTLTSEFNNSGVSCNY